MRPDPNVTINQPSACDAADSPSDEDDDPRVVSDESDDDSELQEIVNAFYAD